MSGRGGAHITDYISPATGGAVHAAYKKVREGKLSYQRIAGNPDALEKLHQIVAELPRGQEKKMRDLDLKSNVRNWVIELLKGPGEERAKRLLEFLLNDFTDSMRSRMREQEKYAVALLFEDDKKLLICHSVYGEATITPEWKIYPRLLDSGNVLRYVSFTLKEGEVHVRFYEKVKTRSLAEWLGMPPSEAIHYYGGKYRVYFTLAGFDAVLELGDEDVERLLAEYAAPTFEEDGLVLLPTPVNAITVRRVVVGKNLTLSPREFKETYYSMRYGVDALRKKFFEIVSSLNAHMGEIIDRRHEVVLKTPGGEETLARKNYEGVELLFAAKGRIRLDPAYLAEMASSLTSGISLLHVADPLAPAQLRVGEALIYNRVEAPPPIGMLATKAAKLEDPFLRTLLHATAFLLLAGANEKLKLSYTLKMVARKALTLLHIPESLGAPEDELLEYKSSDFLFEALAKPETLLRDVEAKLRGSPAKLYLFGVEDDGQAVGFASSRLKSDLAGRVEALLEKKLGVEAFAVPVAEGGKALLALLVTRK